MIISLWNPIKTISIHNSVLPTTQRQTDAENQSSAERHYMRHQPSSDLATEEQFNNDSIMVIAHLDHEVMQE